jgi:hypothetical protein
MLADPLIDLRGITLDPAKHRRVIHFESALSHHLFEVAVRQLVATVPTNTQKDERGLEVPPLERGLVLLQGYDSRRVIDEPEENNSSTAIPATEPFNEPCSFKCKTL